MSTKRLRELDEWIAKTMFSHGEYVGLVKNGFWYRPDAAGYTSNESEAGRYLIGQALTHTTDPRLEDAVQVQEFTIPCYTDVLKKCAEKARKSICLCICPKGFEVYFGGGKSIVKGRTLELAICLFAKKLFT